MVLPCSCFLFSNLSNVLKTLKEFHGHIATSYEVVLDDFDLPGLAELKGRWHGSLESSGGGNGDTMVTFSIMFCGLILFQMIKRCL